MAHILVCHILYSKCATLYINMPHFYVNVPCFLYIYIFQSTTRPRNPVSQSVCQSVSQSVSQSVAVSVYFPFNFISLYIPINCPLFKTGGMTFKTGSLLMHAQGWFCSCLMAHGSRRNGLSPPRNHLIEVII